MAEREIGLEKRQKAWDHHGSYQWTYFEEEIKQRISYFLSQRLHGKNLEMGGGWYLSYPNSTVIDLSPKCLSYNPAQEKIQFDLDQLGHGQKLPLPDNSFDAATMVSVWQYLHYPKAVVAELERVLRPGSPIYIINHSEAGLPGFVVNDANSTSIQKHFQNLGFDTLVEAIPYIDGKTSSLHSVCVATHQPNLFNENVSIIDDKACKVAQDIMIRQNPKVFMDDFLSFEFGNILRSLSQITTFPITQYSKEYLRKIDEFSHDYQRQTGDTPLVFMENTIEPELFMTTPQDKFPLTTIYFLEEDRFNSERNDFKIRLLQQYNLGLSPHLNLFHQTSPQDLIDYCKGFKYRAENWRDGGNKDQLNRLVYFIGAWGLNSFTTDLQEKARVALTTNVPDIDERLKDEKAKHYFFAAREYKQRRRTDDISTRKNQLLSSDVPLTGIGTVDLWPILPSIMKCLEKQHKFHPVYLSMDD